MKYNASKFKDLYLDRKRSKLWKVWLLWSFEKHTFFYRKLLLPPDASFCVESASSFILSFSLSHGVNTRYLTGNLGDNQQFIVASSLYLFFLALSCLMGIRVLFCSCLLPFLTLSRMANLTDRRVHFTLIYVLSFIFIINKRNNFNSFLPSFYGVY